MATEIIGEDHLGPIEVNDVFTVEDKQRFKFTITRSHDQSNGTTVFKQMGRGRTISFPVEIREIDVWIHQMYNNISRVPRKQNIRDIKEKRSEAIA